MNDKLDITAALETLRNGPSGVVSEPFHLHGFNSCSDFTKGRATKRFVEANMDMLVHHFVKETTYVDGINDISDEQVKRQDQLVELVTEYLLGIRGELDA